MNIKEKEIIIRQRTQVANKGGNRFTIEFPIAVVNLAESGLNEITITVHCLKITHFVVIA